jgi:MOSC domain-containing protein YiiM
MGRLEAIWTKRAHGGPMDPRESARSVENVGLEGCAGGGGSWRQVTVIEKEVFDELMVDLPDLDPSMRRANLMVSGVRLKECGDKILQVGGLRLHMRAETRPCDLMEEQCPGLQAALLTDWKAGAFGRVLNDAEISVGDAVTWVEAGAGAAG